METILLVFLTVLVTVLIEVLLFFTMGFMFKKQYWWGYTMGKILPAVFNRPICLFYTLDNCWEWEFLSLKAGENRFYHKYSNGKTRGYNLTPKSEFNLSANQRQYTYFEEFENPINWEDLRAGTMKFLVDNRNADIVATQVRAQEKTMYDLKQMGQGNIWFYILAAGIGIIIVILLLQGMKVA